jgi:ketosteroid isomerase-like protein
VVPIGHLLNVEAVRRIYEAWNEDGLDVLAPRLAADVELDDPPEMPDAGNWRGRDRVLARLEDVASAVGGGWVDIKDVRAVGDEVLVSMVWQEDESKGSPPFGEVFHLVRTSGEEIVRMRVFLDREAAVEAAGA